MNRFDRFYRRSLRDILVDQGVVTREEADDLAESAYEANETFGHAVVDAGHLTSWELARTVASHFQMPMLPLGGFEYDSSLLEGVPAAILFQHHVLPVGRFGQTWSFAVAEPPSREAVAALRDACGSAIFFLAAPTDDVQKLIAEHVKVVDSTSDRTWHNIFDNADERVQQEIDDDVPESGAA